MGSIFPMSLGLCISFSIMAQDMGISLAIGKYFLLLQHELR